MVQCPDEEESPDYSVPRAAMTEPSAQIATANLSDISYFSTSLRHLLAELERIDLLIQVLVWRSRQVQETDEEYQGLYITDIGLTQLRVILNRNRMVLSLGNLIQLRNSYDNEVDSILTHPAGLPRWATLPAPISREQVEGALRLMADEINQRKLVSQERGIRLRLEQLTRTFGLTPFDIDTLLVCLAPEIDGRYERLYAYLHDDVTRKRPSVNLVLNLLCLSLEGKLQRRQHFSADSPLLRYQLLHLFSDPTQQYPTLLGKYLKVDERIANYLLDSDELDPGWHPTPSWLNLSPTWTKWYCLPMSRNVSVSWSSTN
jgi:hypothetical protein